jgi:signal transduction histidine kinase
MVLQWNEKFNVIAGRLNRATFTKVPAGSYTFEAIAASTQGVRPGKHLSLPLIVLSPVWSRPWFWALAATLVVGFVALAVMVLLRHRAEQKLHRLRVQNAIGQERARIARDLHDDLGTRITGLTMNAALARRDLERQPSAARRHLDNLAASAREAASSMDSLVWTVDPANDSLDQLGERLTVLAEEVFQGSGIRCETVVPHLLPDWTLRAEARHNLFLATKEALHNILKHAGPCQAALSLALSETDIRIDITDTGRGFDMLVADRGNGLSNLNHRIETIGGICAIDSRPGGGTRISFVCPLGEQLQNPENKP